MSDNVRKGAAASGASVTSARSLGPCQPTSPLILYRPPGLVRQAFMFWRMDV